MSARRFVAICRVVGLVWVVVAVSGSVWWFPVPRHWDFSHYYLGGLIARRGEWAALYPTPIPDSALNAGWMTGSVAKPRYEELAARVGIEPIHVRFIEPPVTALLLAPLAWLSYPLAFGAFTVLLAVCCWLVACQAARLHECLSGGPSHAQGVLILAICGSPMVIHVCRSGNLSAITGACIGSAVVRMVARGHWLPASLGLALGVVTKYATLPLLPLFWIVRQRRALVGCGVILGLGTGLSMLWSGLAPYREFFLVILPTLGRSSPVWLNESVMGLVMRIPELEPHQDGVLAAVRIVGVLGLIAVVLLAFAKRADLERRSDQLTAVAATLVLWFSLFSPLLWPHSVIFWVAFWGYFTWEAQQGRLRWGISAALAIEGLALTPWKRQLFRHMHVMRSADLDFYAATFLLVVAASAWLQWPLGRRRSALPASASPSSS